MPVQKTDKNLAQRKMDQLDDRDSRPLPRVSYGLRFLMPACYDTNKALRSPTDENTCSG